MAKLEIEIDFEKLGQALAEHDYIEVIRCKDCEWWRTGGATFIHEPFCELISTRCDEDHYCGWAERRSDESERKDP